MCIRDSSNTGSATAIEHFKGTQTTRSDQLVLQGKIDLVAGAKTAINTDVTDLYLISEEDSSITTNGAGAQNFTGISDNSPGATSGLISQQVAIVPNGEVSVKSNSVTVGGQTIDFSTVVYEAESDASQIVGTWNLIANGTGANAISSETVTGLGTITTEVNTAFIQAENGIEIDTVNDLNMLGGITVRNSVVYATGQENSNYALSITGEESESGVYMVSGSTSASELDFNNIFLSKGPNTVKITGANGKTINFNNTFVGSGFELTGNGTYFGDFATRSGLVKQISDAAQRNLLLDAIKPVSIASATGTAALSISDSSNVVLGNAMMVSRYNNQAVIGFDDYTSMDTPRTIMATQDNRGTDGLVDPTGNSGAMVMTGNNAMIAADYTGTNPQRLTSVSYTHLTLPTILLV